MNFELFCRLYRFGTLQDTSPLRPGTVAQVWKLDTDTGPFLLRTLTGREQGDREWAIAEHLTARGFTRFPAIRATGEGLPYTEVDGVWYQVQEFSPGEMPDPALPGVPQALAQTAAELSAALSDFPGGPFIHGDLGPWNLLRGGDGTIRVIDFGEMRPGDCYYDFATLLAGIINHTDGGERRSACREFLTVLNPDRARLLGQFRIWAEDGVRRWSGHSDIMAARFYNALSWAEENLHEL